MGLGHLTNRLSKDKTYRINYNLSPKTKTVRNTDKQTYNCCCFFFNLILQKFDFWLEE